MTGKYDSRQDDYKDPERHEERIIYGLCVAVCLIVAGAGVGAIIWLFMEETRIMTGLTVIGIGGTAIVYVLGYLARDGLDEARKWLGEDHRLVRWFDER